MPSLNTIVLCVCVAKLRIGYSFTAKEHSEATHKIPRDFKLANKNYAAITNAIKDIIRNDVSLLPSALCQDGLMFNIV